MIEAIAAISSVTEAMASVQTSGANQTNGANFLATLEREFEKVNTDVASAETGLQQLATGQPVELHSVMIALREPHVLVPRIPPPNPTILD
ncbi:MAG: flagellar hook-basal body complex protein FliE [Pseudomonadota bacterium]